MNIQHALKDALPRAGFLRIPLFPLYALTGDNIRYAETA